MSRYDGLIIPRSYSEYINKTDAATLQQALQLSGVLSGTVAAGDNKAVKSDAVATALAIRTQITDITAQITRNEDITIQHIIIEKQLNIVRGYINFTSTAPMAKETAIISGLPEIAFGYVDIPIINHTPDTFVGYARINSDGSLVSEINSLPAGFYRLSFIYMCDN